MNIRGKCNSCCVPGCNSNSTPSFRNRGGRITTFKLPRDETRRKEWIQAIPKRKYPPTVNHNVCILHFNEADFSRNNRRIDLKKSAVPSIFPFVDGQHTDDQTADVTDEVWNEYDFNSKESMKKAVDLSDESFPSPLPDLSRILIERLRVDGSKYFGIDTADIIGDPDFQSDSESDESMQNSKAIAKKRRKIETVPVDDVAVDDSDDDFSDNIEEFSLSSIEETKKEENSIIPIQPNVINASDDEAKFGTMVGSKLLLMTPLQRLMSQKIISEILLKGQLSMLKTSNQPVVVSGYMKNVAKGNGGTCEMLPNDDPLMLKVKHEEHNLLDELEAFEEESLNIIKDEVC